MSKAITMYSQFIGDLKHTFPEFADKLVPESYHLFIANWINHKTAISTCDASVFATDGFELVPGLPMNTTLWAELSDNTRTIIWKYIAAILVLADTNTDKSDIMKQIIDQLMSHIKADTGENMGGFANIIKHFTDMIGSNDESAAPIESFEDLVAKFKLPDIIINGRIAKLVKEIFGSFSLEEFGLTPEILSNQEKTLEHLKYLLESQPEIIKKSIDKLIATVKFKLENGSIKKDDLIDELKSIVAELAANEELKKVFGNHSAILSTVLDSLTSQKSEPSERCKEVRERLKKKAEAKKATKTTTSLIVSPAAEAKAAAAMAALLKEELNTPIKSKRK